MEFAAVWAFSQLPSDFTHQDEEDALDSLLGYRVVFRQAHQSAPGALAFLGSDDRDANIHAATSLETGQCLLRDPTGRLGLVAVQPPDDPHAVAALSTTPGQPARNIGRWHSLDASPNGNGTHQRAEPHP